VLWPNRSVPIAKKRHLAGRMTKNQRLLRTGGATVAAMALQRMSLLKEFVVTVEQKRSQG
jgi:hypothetical protein